LSYLIFNYYFLFVYSLSFFFLFFFNAPATTEIYTLSLHDALPISPSASAAARRRLVAPWTRHGPRRPLRGGGPDAWCGAGHRRRSEEHTSELQSRFDLVCRLLLEKKKKKM